MARLPEQLEDELYEITFHMKEKYLFLLANSGDTDAQLALGQLYFYDNSFDWAYERFQKAAEGGSADALYYIGEYYTHPEGYGVVEASNEKAVEYFNKAIEGGSVEAMFDLGFLGYIEGSYCPKNVSKGIDLLNKSAELGFYASYYVLSQLYQYGIGVEKNLEIAVDYAQKAYTIVCTQAYIQGHPI